jgi:RHS repeat-associated protein
MTDGSFTGQTQDVVQGQTGIYDFLFRQHASSQGRWLVPDPAGLAAVDPTNPQTWNRYAYVANNPLSNIDPIGLKVVPCAAGKDRRVAQPFRVNRGFPTWVPHPYRPLLAIGWERCH